MTIADVKRDLPNVKIQYAGQLYWGRVSGRLNKFATVSPHQLVSPRKRVATIMGPCFEFSWDSILRAVVSGGILDSCC